MRVYKPLSNSYEIHQLSVRSEFDLQADLYARLKQDGFDVSANRTYKNHAAFDLTVFGENRQAVAIIETKREDEGHRVHLDQTEQGTKYRHFGVPVILFWDMTKYEELKSFLCGKRKVFTKQSDEYSLPKNNAIDKRLRDLRRRLDVASMAAFDAAHAIPDQKFKFSQMEQSLEMWRDAVEDMYRKLL